MPLDLQHVIVTVIALGAVWIIVRRVFDAVTPGPSSHKCDSCPAAPPKQTRDAAVNQDTAVKPLILVKHRRG